MKLIKLMILMVIDGCGEILISECEKVQNVYGVFSVDSLQMSKLFTESTTYLNF